MAQGSLHPHLDSDNSLHSWERWGSWVDDKRAEDVREVPEREASVTFLGGRDSPVACGKSWCSPSRRAIESRARRAVHRSVCCSNFGQRIAMGITLT